MSDDPGETLRLPELRLKVDITPRQVGADWPKRESVYYHINMITTPLSAADGFVAA